VPELIGSTTSRGSCATRRPMTLNPSESDHTLLKSLIVFAWAASSPI
jgi:hypothetical protein